MKSKPGPFQYCDICKKNKSHTWIADLLLACECGKETKVNQAPKKGLEEIIKEVIGKEEDWPVQIDPNGNIHFKGKGVHIVGGPGLAAEFDKAMKEEASKITRGWGDKLK